MALLFDCETDGLLDKLTRIHCLVIKDTETGEVLKLHGDDRFTGVQYGLGILEAAPVIAGHNVIKFDVPAIQKIYPWFKPKGLVRDTLTMTRLIWSDLKERDFERIKTDDTFPKQLIGAHSLKAWGYRLGFLKGEYGDTTDWKSFTPEMLEYCVRDVEVTHKLWDRIAAENYSERAIDLEHKFQEVLWLQEQRGFAFDKKAAVDLYGRLGQRRMELEREIKAMCPGWYIDMKVPAYWYVPNLSEKQYATKAEGVAAGVKAKHLIPGPVKRKHIEMNPSSRDHVARVLIERYGWKPKEYTGEGRPIVDESVLSGMVYPEAKLVNELFLLEKRIGQLAEGAQAWLRLETNGRIHGTVITNGAVTGRCTHSKPNVSQVPGVGAPYGKECRSLFHASPGYVLVGCDASGLELRCLAHFMARYDGGAYAKELLSGDIHTLNQKAAGLETRSQAKTMIYGYLYGAGDEKLGAIIGKGAREGKALKERLLKNLPALKRLREDVIAAAKARGYLVGLDGRHLPIRSEHSALNTLLQSAGALIIKEATVGLHGDLCSKGWQFGVQWAQVAHAHDEIQSEVKEGLEQEYGAAALSAMQRAGESFSLRCRIDAEFKVGRNWAECH